MFESPHRIADTLVRLAEVIDAERSVSVCRELTKLHESVTRGSAAELAKRFADGTRGELTVVIEGQRNKRKTVDPAVVDAAISEGLSEGTSPRDLSRQVADALGLPKRQIYTRIQELLAPRDADT